MEAVHFIAVLHNEINRPFSYSTKGPGSSVTFIEL